MLNSIIRKKSGIDKWRNSIDFLKYILKKEPGIICLELLSYILAMGIFPVIAANYWGKVVDSIFLKNGNVVNYLILLGLFGGISSCYMFFSEILDNVFRNRISLVMQERVHLKASKISAELYESGEVQDVVRKSQSAFFYGPAIGFFFSMVAVCASVAAMIANLWVLLQYHFILVVCMMGIFLVEIAKIYMQKKRAEVRQKFVSEHRTLDNLKTYIKEANKVKESKIWESGSFFAKKWSDEFRSVSEKENQLYRKNNIGVFGINILSGILYGLILGMCILLMVKDVLLIGAFSSIVLLVRVAKNNVETLVNALSGLESDLVDLEGGYKFLNLEEEGKNGEKLKEINEIEFKNVGYQYPETSNEVLQEVSVKLKRGELVAIVGENGAGKSTIAKLILGLYQVSTGVLTINKHDSLKCLAEEKYKKMSAVFQEFGQYPLTVEENISLGSQRGKFEQEMLKLEFVNDLKEKEKTLLKKEVGGEELSGGQWQQLALARCLYKNGAILVLDEPTASLDAFKEKELFEAFKQITRGRIGVIITHRLGIVKIVNRILVVKNGRLIGDGTHEQLIESVPYYKELWDAQKQLYEIKEDEMEDE